MRDGSNAASRQRARQSGASDRPGQKRSDVQVPTEEGSVPHSRHEQNTKAHHAESGHASNGAGGSASDGESSEYEYWEIMEEDVEEEEPVISEAEDLKPGDFLASDGGSSEYEYWEIIEEDLEEEEPVISEAEDEHDNVILGEMQGKSPCRRTSKVKQKVLKTRARGDLVKLAEDEHKNAIPVDEQQGRGQCRRASKVKRKVLKTRARGDLVKLAEDQHDEPSLVHEQQGNNKQGPSSNMKRKVLKTRARGDLGKLAEDGQDGAILVPSEQGKSTRRRASEAKQCKAVRTRARVELVQLAEQELQEAERKKDIGVKGHASGGKGSLRKHSGETASERAEEVVRQGLMKAMQAGTLAKALRDHLEAPPLERKGSSERRIGAKKKNSQEEAVQEDYKSHAAAAAASLSPAQKGPFAKAKGSGSKAVASSKAKEEPRHPRDAAPRGRGGKASPLSKQAGSGAAVASRAAGMTAGNGPPSKYKSMLRLPKASKGTKTNPPTKEEAAAIGLKEAGEKSSVQQSFHDEPSPTLLRQSGEATIGLAAFEDVPQLPSMRTASASAAAAADSPTVPDPFEEAAPRGEQTSSWRHIGVQPQRGDQVPQEVEDFAFASSSASSVSSASSSSRSSSGSPPSSSRSSSVASVSSLRPQVGGELDATGKGDKAAELPHSAGDAEDERPLRAVGSDRPSPGNFRVFAIADGFIKAITGRPQAPALPSYEEWFTKYGAQRLSDVSSRSARSAPAAGSRSSKGAKRGDQRKAGSSPSLKFQGSRRARGRHDSPRQMTSSPVRSASAERSEKVRLNAPLPGTSKSRSESRDGKTEARGRSRSGGSSGRSARSASRSEPKHTRKVDDEAADNGKAAALAAKRRLLAKRRPEDKAQREAKSETGQSSRPFLRAKSRPKKLPGKELDGQSGSKRSEVYANERKDKFENEVGKMVNLLCDLEMSMASVDEALLQTLELSIDQWPAKAAEMKGTCLQAAAGRSAGERKGRQGPKSKAASPSLSTGGKRENDVDLKLLKSALVQSRALEDQLQEAKAALEEKGRQTARAQAKAKAEAARRAALKKAARTPVRITENICIACECRLLEGSNFCINCGKVARSPPKRRTRF
eukprot:TRINITY_DN42898_c0_g3_i2.p1 TRINITY_DN42898_c0_g3~~TRINITY_DN42898_c0_g3_i2.p1  ORF type:complete len:1105 (+),score=292.76 TRINITY_DN42898_c0_g3_i2:214-3528(+)